MPIQQYLLPHRIQETLSCCPTGVATYATLHLDSIAKILNHLLCLMLVFNVLLFFASWNVALLPAVGFNTTLVAFFLLFQNVCVWLILNNNRVSGLAFLAPSDFTIGLGLGITIGGAILSFVVSTSFRSLSKCTHAQDDPLYEYMCGERKGSMNAVWFWSGLVFWFNFCSSLLLAVGRRELTQASQYQMIDSEDIEDHMRRIRAGQNIPGSFPTPQPTFVGDYANVPEVRPDDDDSRSIGSSSSHGRRTETARIIQNV